jgi:hypothetical protein
LTEAQDINQSVIIIGVPPYFDLYALDILKMEKKYPGISLTNSEF